MARKVRHSKLETRTARLKLAVRRKPYNGPSIARGVQLHYRRNKTNGTWVLKASDGHGKYWTKAFAEADDFDESNGGKVLTFFEAQDTAKKLARGDGEADTTAPVTVDRALIDYKRDLTSRGADPYNAEHPRRHLTAVLLAKPVALLTSRELKAWRDGLLGKLEPASINRVGTCVRAACELAAQHDRRIQNRDAWEVGLAVLPGAQTARNVVLHRREGACARRRRLSSRRGARLARRHAGDDRRAPGASLALARRGPSRSPGKTQAHDAEGRQGRRAEPEREESRTLFGADHARVVRKTAEGGGTARTRCAVAHASRRLVMGRGPEQGVLARRARGPDSRLAKTRTR